MDYFPGIAKGFGVNISPVTAWLLDPTNSNDSATDFAVGGSTTRDLSVENGTLPQGSPTQVDAYVGRVKNAADDLCVIWCGANDFFAGIKPLETVANIKSAIAQLSQAGAKHIVVVTVPEFALTPQERALGGATVLAATQFVVTTNVLLAIELPRIAFANQIRIHLVDFNAIFAPVVFQPARFGFTNSSGFAYKPLNGPLLVNLVNDNPNNYVFWDGFYPTTNVHKLAAAFIFKNRFFSGQIRPFLSFR
ncbi:MAG: hypothetical protein JO170_18955 [Verrucomicrobia bacterium]|nr:hypothetical protein [Verrucomicrobiota bacterium]